MADVRNSQWRVYDDSSILRENYAAMQKFFQFVRDSAGPDLLEPGRTTFFPNDWLHLDDPTEQGILGTAYYAENARMTAEVAEALGDEAAASDYSKLSADTYSRRIRAMFGVSLVPACVKAWNAAPE